MTNEITCELESLIARMRIPHFRKSIDKVNLKWLKKNLGKYNSDDPNYNRAMELIEVSLTEKLYNH